MLRAPSSVFALSLAFALGFVFAPGVSGAAKAEVTASDVDALYAFMALTPARGEAARFVATDNIAGYYEGYSYRFHDGAGYRVRDTSLLAGHASLVEDRLLRRDRDALADHILPYGHRADYAHAREALMVHSGRAAVSLRVESDRAARLAIAPLLAEQFGAYTLSRRDDLLLLTRARDADATLPRYLAVSADAPYSLAQAPVADPDWHGLDAAHALLLRARDPRRAFTLHLAFDTRAERALAQAKALAAEDSWNRERRLRYQALTRSQLRTSDADYNRALLWASASAQSFVVEEFGKGLWAGLPWFRDNWGRDTFISLPGTLLVTGHVAQARAVLENFARYQLLDDPKDRNYGRIPNRVAANTPIIYNTVDGTPWMIREAEEYLRYSGDRDYARRLLPLVRAYLAGVKDHWLDTQGFLTHDDADTWMDARIDNREAWSPRGNRAVEIQALWYTALDVAARLARAAGNRAEADEDEAMMQALRAHFRAAFWDGRHMADRLRPDGSRDMSLRPNALMLISVPFTPLVEPAVESAVLKTSVEHLVFPYGVASLDPAHPNFHPRHENPDYHHKDAAYHNGTVWGWNAGFAVTALTKYGYADRAYALSENLAQQILNLGTRGSMSELLDASPNAQGEPTPSGTYAQAWSVAEFVRNAYQDYLGFRPNLLENELRFVPALPSAWSQLDARLSFGQDEALELSLRRENQSWHWTITPHTRRPYTLTLDLLDREGARQRATLSLDGRPLSLRWNGSELHRGNQRLPVHTVQASVRETLGALPFATPPVYDPRRFRVLGGRNRLRSELTTRPESHAHP